MSPVGSSTSLLLGTLDSATTLGIKVQERAVGGPGPGSLSAALGQHIESV
ncbi:hypothetical protein [Nocardia harenae]|nr:hypothetical protein [Nocardia harenae]